MCPDRKQILTGIALAGWLAALGAGPAVAGQANAGSAAPASAGGLTLGATHRGITDAAYVTAPPNWLYVVERERGSFLDCGEGQDQRATDSAGRDAAPLSCGVTLTETVVIPAASTSARIIIHY